jgi:hypothetical protein
MKKPPALVVTDLDPTLGPPLANLFHRCATNPREKIGEVFIPRLARKVGPLFIYDWRKFAFRYLRRYLPRHCWIYRGGRHLAIHASPPRGGKTWMQGGEAGKCLARICEAKHAL